MDKIYEVKGDIHCPRCGAYLNKSLGICRCCDFNPLEITYYYSGNSVAKSVPTYQKLIWRYCNECKAKGKFYEAAYFYQLLARQFDDASAMYELGLLFLYGTGVIKSSRKARLCFEAAATLLHNPSTIKLGYLYYSGKYGFSRDTRKSLEWFEKASSLDETSYFIYQKLLKSLNSTEFIIVCEDDEEDEDDESLSEEQEKAFAEWEVEQDDSMLHDSDRDYYYSIYADDDYTWAENEF